MLSPANNHLMHVDRYCGQVLCFIHPCVLTHFIALGVLCVYEFLCALWDAQRPKPVSFDIGSLLFLHTQIAHK